jgi:hypothetical protein
MVNLLLTNILWIMRFLKSQNVDLLFSSICFYNTIIPNYFAIKNK